MGDTSTVNQPIKQPASQPPACPPLTCHLLTPGASVTRYILNLSHALASCNASIMSNLWNPTPCPSAASLSHHAVVAGQRDTPAWGVFGCVRGRELQYYKSGVFHLLHSFNLARVLIVCWFDVALKLSSVSRPLVHWTRVRYYLLQSTARRVWWSTPVSSLQFHLYIDSFRCYGFLAIYRLSIFLSPFLSLACVVTGYGRHFFFFMFWFYVLSFFFQWLLAFHIVHQLFFYYLAFLYSFVERVL